MNPLPRESTSIPQSVITTPRWTYHSAATVDMVDELMQAGALIPAWDDNGHKVFLSPYAVSTVQEADDQ